VKCYPDKHAGKEVAPDLLPLEAAPERAHDEAARLSLELGEAPAKTTARRVFGLPSSIDGLGPAARPPGGVKR
jgi:hypothetical protein